MKGHRRGGGKGVQSKHSSNQGATLRKMLQKNLGQVHIKLILDNLKHILCAPSFDCSE